MLVTCLHLCLIYMYIFIMFNNNTIIYHSEHISVIITLTALSTMH